MSRIAGDRKRILDFGFWDLRILDPTADFADGREWERVKNLPPLTRRATSEDGETAGEDCHCEESASGWRRGNPARKSGRRRIRDLCVLCVRRWCGLGFRFNRGFCGWARMGKGNEPPAAHAAGYVGGAVDDCGGCGLWLRSDWISDDRRGLAVKSFSVLRGWGGPSSRPVESGVEPPHSKTIGWQ